MACTSLARRGGNGGGGFTRITLSHDRCRTPDIDSTTQSVVSLDWSDPPGRRPMSASERDLPQSSPVDPGLCWWYAGRFLGRRTRRARGRMCSAPGWRRSRLPRWCAHKSLRDLITGGEPAPPRNGEPPAPDKQRFHCRASRSAGTTAAPTPPAATGEPITPQPSTSSAWTTSPANPPVPGNIPVVVTPARRPHPLPRSSGSAALNGPTAARRVLRPKPCPSQDPGPPPLPCPIRPGHATPEGTPT